MIKFDTLKQATHFRVVESEDNYWVEDYWKATIELSTNDVAATIMFLQNDCDDEELYFLSEIFEEIVEQTQSKELVSVLRSRLAKVTPPKITISKISNRNICKSGLTTTSM